MLKIWFIGGGAFAASCLTLMSKELTFSKIVTGLPTKAGRGLKDRPSAVEAAALDLGLAVERTGPLLRNEALTNAMITDPPDLAFVVDFAQLIKEPFLNGPRHGCLNIHPSLLPRWRGAAPLQRAILNGDAATGVTVFRLVEAMDAGPILAQAEIPMLSSEDSADLFQTLALAGSQIAVQSVESIIEGNCQFSAQDSEFVTYAAKLDKEEARVSWHCDNVTIHNVVRAFASSGGAFVTIKGGRLKIWRTVPEDVHGIPGSVISSGGKDLVVACAKGAVRLAEVQAEGKRRVSGAEWRRGIHLEDGEVLT